MARRKISLEEHVNAIEAMGLRVKLEAAVVEQPPIDPGIIVKEKEDVKVYGKKVGKNGQMITLYAKHSVGCGGYIVEDANGKHVENAGVQSYGPGRVYVPNDFVDHLLHQDALAQEADRKMLSSEQLKYIVAPRVGRDGQRANVGIATGSLDVADLTNAGVQFLHVIG